MVSSSLGFNKDQVAIVELSGKLIKNTGTLENQLKNEMAIENVAFSEDLLSWKRRMYNLWTSI